ncbi:3-oxoacyl-ACP reductase [Catellatospora sp. TT07R-123]|uniref:SDR family NAD(P)-dependent oxidoreductase n=1 Tax=Catellatospora sp. TT07R-123 TaxID=2733863 RepID=UPI001B296F6C|nr:SDR family oxidoreductase [Catellatospora sp. TT07R-123]GHJ47751.1 3-oxoacyl-ACP reductase [Catellatospora sp. TT07R-123]
MLLKGKNAIVYGAGGAIGGAVSRAFAAQGAVVHLVGRTPARLDHVARQIRDSGGAAEPAAVDALDEAAVTAHVDAVAEQFGSVDVTLNVISHGAVLGRPLTEISLDDFEQPVRTALRTNFLTARAAARHMAAQRSGAILLFGGYGDPMPNLGGMQVAFGGLESLRRALACELGPRGVRVITLQTGGVPETIPAGMPGRADVTAAIEAKTMLGRAASLADVGNVAVFAASDAARSITATSLNITCGAVPA